MKPTFSVIIPLAENAPSRQLRNSLRSLTQQALKNQEIIIVTSPNAKKSLFRTLKDFPRVKVLKKNLSKTAARNFGAKRALGKFLIHVDVDTTFEKNALKQVLDLIRNKKAKTIILHEKVRPTNFLTRIRSLERKFNLHDPYLATPQVIEAKLFEKIEGFDETIDILDDWSLHFQLKRAKVKFFATEPLISIDETRGISEIFSRKYIRGQYIPFLADKYPEFSKIRHSQRLAVYVKNWRLFLADPIASIGLFLLKPLEWLTLFLAARYPPQMNVYQKEEVAKNYDRIRKANNYRLFKNFTEKKALKILLEPKPEQVLEIGAGTGRITKFLINMGIKVLPTEPSEPMIKEYLKKKGLPKPLKISGEKLSPNLGKFNCVLGMRIIWHLKDAKKHLKIFQNASSLTKKSVIFDFANAARYKNPLLYLFFLLYGLIFNRNFYRNDYFFSLKEIEKLGKQSKLRIEKMLPLDLLTPLWLNLLPKKIARKLFPSLLSLEHKLARFIPPGRWLIKFSRSTK